jgi:gamma-glutamyltranspeptidase/glutathione hydrolase
MKLAVATTSELAARAGADIAVAGGNAVDAAIAAAMVSFTTEPGVCAPGCGGYLTVWPRGERPITLDGNIFAPGRGLAPAERGQGGIEIWMEYGGGVSTVIGPGSIGVPGGIAALGEGSARFGKLPWKLLVEPSMLAAQNGFPLPQASHAYLQISGTKIFGRSDDGFKALHHEDGRLKAVGELIHIPHLAESLQRIAEYGPREFYEGELGRTIVAHVRDHGGSLTLEDMQACEAISRPSLMIDTGSWQVATNPPPAVGGAVLGAMLTLISTPPLRDWDSAALQRLVDVQHASLCYRRDCLDLSDHIEADAARLLELAHANDLSGILRSPSTVHTSCVDDSGLACAITMSAGYGSGEMPAGTGLWLNNCLGELELNKRGLDTGPPGASIPSNMAPTVAKSKDAEVMAIGSPGADRITTAILQVLVNYLHIGMPLHEAVEHPRAHVELDGDGFRVAHEPGLRFDQFEFPTRSYDGLSMYFGGVGAVTCSGTGSFELAADPRRVGGVWRSPP